MYSQPRTNAGNNLQRTKSTTSVKERRKHPLQAEPINPQTARTYALIAANRAVDRSRTSHSSELGRSESVVSRNGFANHQEQAVVFSPASHLRRQRSTLQSRVPKLADTLRLPRDCGQERGIYDELGLEADFGIAGENYGALPSSYRRLKRSKSLLTPMRQTYRPHSRTPETSLSQAPTLRTTAGSAVSTSPSLKVRLKRSLKFLRAPQAAKDRVITAPSLLETGPQKPCHPEAIRIAKEQFSEGASGSPTFQDRSVIVTSKTSRVQKAFRKTFRTPDLKNTALLSPSRATGIVLGGPEDRSSSISISGRVKRLFTRSKQDESLPPQQLDATRPYFNALLSTNNSEAGFDSYLEPDTPASGRTSIYVPSNSHPDTCSDVAQLSTCLSRSASADSLSLKSKSRVTSWTNSTTTRSISSQPVTFEPKRLSIIREDGGPHQPSSSAGRHIGGVSVFQQPLNVPEGQVVDSHGVYSALVKRIEQEHKEIESTKAALKEIHNAEEQDDVVGHYLFSAPTIRRVRSNASASLSKIEEDASALHNRTSLRNETLNITNSECCYNETPEISVDSNDTTFRPYLHPGKNEIVSRRACQKNLNEKDISVSTETLHGSRTEASSVIVRSDIYRCSSTSRYDGSPGSIYSRTTNGGTNADYMSPLASTEELSTPLNIENGLDVVAQTVHSSAGHLDLSQSRSGHQNVMKASEKGTWQGWMEHQIESLEPKTRSGRSNAHFREHAQINSEDTEIGSTPARQSTLISGFQSTRNQYSENLMSQTSSMEGFQTVSIQRLRNPKTPLLQLREVPRNLTSAPNKNTSIRHSQSAFLNGARGREHHCGTNDQKMTGLRRISSANIASALRVRKSQPVLHGELDYRKENIPAAMQDSPPVSTPGHHEMQGQLRRGRSAIALGQSHDRLGEVSNHAQGKDSPAERQKLLLSARLSRPFDMDVPDHNRPFDSTYLGKREAGNGSRLSVAPTASVLRRPKTYGDLTPPPFSNNGIVNQDVNKDFDTTALPALKACTDTQMTESGYGLGMAGKRIVSSFLRSRKKSDGSAGGLAFV